MAPHPRPRRRRLRRRPPARHQGAGRRPRHRGGGHRGQRPDRAGQARRSWPRTWSRWTSRCRSWTASRPCASCEDPPAAAGDHVQHADRAGCGSDARRAGARRQRLRHQAGQRRQRRRGAGERARAARPEDQGAVRVAAVPPAGPPRAPARRPAAGPPGRSPPARPAAGRPRRAGRPPRPARRAGRSAVDRRARRAGRAARRRCRPTCPCPSSSSSTCRRSSPRMFAERLDAQCALRGARGRPTATLLRPGHGLLAPGDFHMRCAGARHRAAASARPGAAGELLPARRRRRCSARPPPCTARRRCAWSSPAWASDGQRGARALRDAGGAGRSSRTRRARWSGACRAPSLGPAGRPGRSPLVARLRRRHCWRRRRGRSRTGRRRDAMTPDRRRTSTSSASSSAGASAIVLEPGKEYLVESRLLPLARRAARRDRASWWPGCAPAPAARSTSMVEAMTTNETSFFRDVAPVRRAARHVLPTCWHGARRSRGLAIWSAACSSGQEPYSIAMTVCGGTRGARPAGASRILATDLSDEMLAAAAAGRYSQLEVNRGLPAPMLVEVLQPRTGPTGRSRRELRADGRVPPDEPRRPCPPLRPFDLVFLRNVLIYFDADDKRPGPAPVRTSAPGRLPVPRRRRDHRSTWTTTFERVAGRPARPTTAPQRREDERHEPPRDGTAGAAAEPPVDGRAGRRASPAGLGCLLGTRARGRRRAGAPPAASVTRESSHQRRLAGLGAARAPTGPAPPPRRCSPRTRADLAEDEIADALGELANMIGGNIKSLLPGPARCPCPASRAARLRVSVPGAELVRGRPALGASRPVTIWRLRRLPRPVPLPRRPSTERPP